MLPNIKVARTPIELTDTELFDIEYFAQWPSSPIYNFVSEHFALEIPSAALGEEVFLWEQFFLKSGYSLSSDGYMYGHMLGVLLDDTAYSVSVARYIAHMVKDNGDTWSYLFRDEYLRLIAVFPDVARQFTDTFVALATDRHEDPDVRYYAAEILWRTNEQVPVAIDAAIALHRTGTVRVPRFKLEHHLSLFLKNCVDEHEAQRICKFVTLSTSIELSNSERFEVLSELDWIQQAFSQVVRLLRRAVRQSTDFENLKYDVQSQFAIQLANDPYVGMESFLLSPIQNEIRRLLSNAVSRYIRSIATRHEIVTDPTILGDIASGVAHDIEVAASEEVSNATLQAIDQYLNDLETQIFHDRFTRNYTRAQIAIARKITVHTVRRVESNAIAKLKQALSHFVN